MVNPIDGTRNIFYLNEVLSIRAQESAWRALTCFCLRDTSMKS